MAALLNLIWITSGRWFIGMLWVVAGIICCATIIMIPFGAACFRIARVAISPFGIEIVPCECVGEARTGWHTIGNVVWAVMFGIWLSAITGLIGLCYCLTIIGIPWGIACFRIARISFAPLGVRIVDKNTYRLMGGK